MPLSKNRELISISRTAHKHLRAVVDRMKKSGIPINGAMLASEAILSIPLPEPAPKAAAGAIEKKRKAQPSTAAVSAL